MSFDLEGIAFHVHLADLPGLMLGRTVGNTIQIDPGAARVGRHLRRTDADFDPGGRLGELMARPGTDAAHRSGLLTAVMQELRPLPGREQAEHGLMQPVVRPGARRLPAGDAISPFADEQALLDDGALEPARLDAYFAALG